MSRFSWAESKASLRKEPQRVRLELEALEDRLVLSTTTYTVAAGDVAGLIADIKSANTSGVATTINLTQSTYDFTSADNTSFGPNALPVITGDITINGNGAVLQRDPSLGQKTPFRFFYISGNQIADPSSNSPTTGQPTGSLTLTNLTLEGGLAQGGSSDLGGGGLGAGGAILNMGNLTANGVTMEQNIAQGGSGGTGKSTSGGGLGNSDTSTTGNFGLGGDGSSSSSGGAGGFGGGGGAGSTGAATGGFGAGAGNGSAGGGGLGAGGALFNMYGTTTLINCTLASNLAEAGSGGNSGDGYGGAVFNVDGTLDVVTSTLADNSTTGGANGGGAVYNLAMGINSSGSGVPSTVTLTDSILADSIASNDLVNDQNTSTAGAAVVNATDPNIVMNLSTLDGATTNGTPNSANPQLGLLLNYGGPTPTMPLLSGSPALGAGSTGSNVPSTDQSGNSRGSVIDLGAVQETSASTTAATTLTLTNSGSTGSGASVTLTATVTPSSGSTTPTGSVDFVDTTTGATLGSASLTGSNPAQATLTTTAVSSGDTITATYTSSNSLGGSSGTTTVSSASSTSSGSTPTTVNLASSSSSNSTGLSVTLTATITASAGTTPAGTVTFVDTSSGNPLGTATVTTVNGMAEATTTTSLASSGDTITATYTSSNGLAGSSGTTTVGAATSSSQTQQWLNSVYQTLLGRPIDASGLSSWGKALNNGTSETQVVLDIEESTEYETDEIQAAYKDLLGVAAPSSAVTYLVGLMQQGTTIQVVEGIIAGSNAFYTASGGTNQSFLNAVYEDFLGRAVDSTGQSTWGALLSAGYTPTQVVLGIMATPEYLTDMVQQDYQIYLGRQGDATSVTAFVTNLSNDSMNNAMVIASLLSSGEFTSQSSTTTMA